MESKKEFVVVKDGQRQSGLLTQEQAEEKADSLRKINEQAGQKNETNVTVKQNLFG